MFLFICMTNLQLLIARSIIEKEQLNSVGFLFIGDVGNVKNQYYLKKNPTVMSTLKYSLSSFKIFDIQNDSKNTVC